MSEHYHDVGDLRFLKEMGKLAPKEFNAWLALDKIIGREDGAIPRKYRELIALGVAFNHAMPLLHRGARESRQGRGRMSRGDYRELDDCSCLARRRGSDARRDGTETVRSSLKLQTLERNCEDSRGD